MQLKIFNPWHKIYLTREPEGECKSPDPAKISKLLRNSCQLPQEQDGYFLFFMFRIATISNATLTIRLSFSYVLIIITTLRKVLGLGESTSPGPLGKYIILSKFVSPAVCQGIL